MVLDDGRRIVDVADAIDVGEGTLGNRARLDRIERSQRAGLPRDDRPSLWSCVRRTPVCGWESVTFRGRVKLRFVGWGAIGWCRCWFCDRERGFGFGGAGALRQVSVATVVSWPCVWRWFDWLRSRLVLMRLVCQRGGVRRTTNPPIVFNDSVHEVLWSQPGIVSVASSRTWTARRWLPTRYIGVLESSRDSVHQFACARCQLHPKATSGISATAQFAQSKTRASGCQSIASIKERATSTDCWCSQIRGAHITKTLIGAHHWRHRGQPTCTLAFEPSRTRRRQPPSVHSQLRPHTFDSTANRSDCVAATTPGPTRS